MGRQVKNLETAKLAAILLPKDRVAAQITHPGRTRSRYGDATPQSTANIVLLTTRSSF